MPSATYLLVSDVLLGVHMNYSIDHPEAKAKISRHWFRITFLIRMLVSKWRVHWGICNRGKCLWETTPSAQWFWLLYLKEFNGMLKEKSNANLTSGPYHNPPTPNFRGCLFPSSSSKSANQLCKGWTGTASPVMAIRIGIFIAKWCGYKVWPHHLGITISAIPAIVVNQIPWLLSKATSCQ